MHHDECFWPTQFSSPNTPSELALPIFDWKLTPNSNVPQLTLNPNVPQLMVENI
jgi:hypothetical protein